MREVGLVADDDERKVGGVARPCLDTEQVVPALQPTERLVRADVVDEDAAVGAAKHAHAQTVKALLTRRVP